MTTRKACTGSHIDEDEEASIAATKVERSAPKPQR